MKRTSLRLTFTQRLPWMPRLPCVIASAAVVIGVASGCAKDSAAAPDADGKPGQKQEAKGTKTEIDRFNGAQTPDQVPEKYRDLARQANAKARARQVPTVKP